MADSVGKCKALHNQENKLRQHSIYILPDDSNTDFDFYVLVDSNEIRKKNEFLKKLHAYLTENNENNRNKLLNSLDEDDPGLKILIEKYPYRLFVAIDKESDWKVNKKTPLDKGFPWNNYSEFIKKRICWIEKNKLEEAFNQNNKNILEIKELNDNSDPVGNNILADDHKFRWQERAKLWLYYKWVEHLMECKGLNELNIHIGISKKKDYFNPLTSPYKERGDTPEKYRIGNKIYYMVPHAQKKEIPNISFSRHDPLATKKSFINNINFIYSQGYSGSQLQYNIIMPFPELFNEFCKILLVIENALFNKLILDERYHNYFYAQGDKIKKKLLWSGILPLKEIKGIFSFEKGENIIVNKIDGKYCIELPAEIQKIKNCEYFFIIHQGILDKIKQPFHKLIIELKDFFPFIIITSGRGKPENVPYGEKFLGFSNVEQVMREYPEDIILTKIIFKVTSSDGG